MADQLDHLTAALADRYNIERELGRGGAATVYLAHDVKHHRNVAVKVLRPELAAVIGAARFLSEIKITANLHHPNILQLYDSGDADGFLYYVMPYVEGKSLRSKLDREKQLPVADAIQFAREVADALHSAHRHDIVHRDIKPENILLQEGHALVADFGISCAIDVAGSSELTEPGLAMGTPAYMSPEQAAGAEDVDGRSDVYSLACVLYEMLTGTPPFTGRTLESVVRQHLGADPKLVTDVRSTVPSPLARALQKALAKTPADRFPTAESFAEALTVGQPARHQKPAAASIAVLPFANMSTDPENEFFTEGITEDIINALTKVPELRVASRTSAFAFKEQNEDIRTIGERLMVSKILEGSVQKAANRLRITAQLINVADGYHLWSEQYDRELDDVFAIQDEISQAIVSTLKIKLSSSHHATLAIRQTANLEAYDLYVKGRYFWNRRGTGLVKARKFFTEATNLDPDYVQAHAALADTYNLLGWYQLSAPQDVFPKAKAAARRALAIDDTVAEAHTSLGFALFYHDWAWQDAEHEFLRAMELHPGYATTHHWYAEYLMAMGRTDEAVGEAERAQQLDPVGLIINVVVGMALYHARHYAEAADSLRRTIEMDPDFGPAYIWLAATLLQMGEYEQAIRASEIEANLAADHPTTYPVRGLAYAALAQRGKAEQLLAECESATKAYRSSYDMAVLHFGLGNKDIGFDWLQRAYDERAVWLVFLNVEPMLDPVRTDERFARLLSRMAFP